MGCGQVVRGRACTGDHRPVACDVQGIPSQPGKCDLRARPGSQATASAEKRLQRLTEPLQDCFLNLGANVINVPERLVVFASTISVALRRPLSILGVLIVAAPLVACASRPESGFLSPVAESVTGAIDHTLLVATTRERDARPATRFNGERASSLDYAAITVSIPPEHVPGQIELT